MDEKILSIWRFGEVTPFFFQDEGKDAKGTEKGMTLRATFMGLW